MPTKKELITNRINKFLLYADEEKLPFVDELRDNVKKYKIEHIVGMVERFIIPVKDCLEEYIQSEFTTAKLLYPEKLEGITIEQATMDRMIKDISYVIKVVEL